MLHFVQLALPRASLKQMNSVSPPPHLQKVDQQPQPEIQVIHIWISYIAHRVGSRLIFNGNIEVSANKPSTVATLSLLFFYLQQVHHLMSPY